MTMPPVQSDAECVDVFMNTVGLPADARPLSPSVTIGADDLGSTRRVSSVPVAPAPIGSELRPSQRPPTLEEPLPKISLAVAQNEARDGRALTGGREPDLEVRSLLGEGGMGSVHLARQRSLRRDVAVKRVKDGVGRALAVDALLREAWTTGRIEHPNIVPVHALGVDDQGGPILVMKRIEGTSWRDLLLRSDHPVWKRLEEQYGTDRRVIHLEILMQVCNALHFAHSRLVIHRDVKPDNVMIGEFGEVYLLDWGIALRKDIPTHTQDAGLQLVGTPYYMSPEMVTGAREIIDARTDVYLLASTLHEILTGRYRHDGSTLRDVLLAAVLSDPVTYDDTVPEDLADLCNRGTHREVDQRPASAAQFRLAIAEHLRHRGSVAIAASAREALEKLESLPGIATREVDALRTDEAGLLMREARFGFLQALREWRSNSAAKEGLDRVVVLMIEREIAQRNSDAAMALYGELQVADTSLRARIDKLAREIAEQRALDDKLKAEAREMDASVSTRARVAFLTLSLGASVVMAGDSVRTELRTGQMTSMKDVMVIDGVITLLLLLGGVLGRKTLFANRISRRLTALSGLAILLSFVNDGLTWVSGGNSRVAGMHSLMLLGSSMFIGATTLLPQLAWPACVLFVAAVISAVYPVATSAAVTFGTMVTMILVINLTLTISRRRDEPATPTSRP